ncbi:MAG: SDR family NAD(P)-dependent oxidoreductase [Peptococcaceae bacterium]|jgi:NAD(P)-dependent dehydrogenase (short-subunit alcohol dehydrogenase family)|nr:SDR family oxidoreductase [Peptococcaceae bacterium]MDH7524160.1 SDR family NAD(P)-dependent oxidoreductase [Peptococcaceae bacterium]
MNRLREKVCIITGAGSGIGKATAEVFIREGARVAVVDVDKAAMEGTVALLKSQGGEAIGLKANICFPEDCERVMEQTAETWGRIDVVVNNAGIGDMFMGTINTSDEHWKRVLEVNLTGTFYICRAAVRHMAGKGGVIVNVSSVGGVYGCAGASYSAAKAGVIGLTKNIAMQYAGRGIRCNAVCPGTTVTPLLALGNRDEFDSDMMKAAGKHFDKTIQPVQPEDQAKVILFFACDESKAITGQCLVSDNGRFL